MGGRGAAEALVLSVERVLDATHVVAEFSMKLDEEFFERGWWQPVGLDAAILRTPRPRIVDSLELVMLVQHPREH
ncbi:MAG: hypothetical protein ACJA2W_003324 [Planctomycetota bacterium]